MPKSMEKLMILFCLMAATSLSTISFAVPFVTPEKVEKFSALDCITRMTSAPDFLNGLAENKAQFSEIWLQDLMEQRSGDRLNERECQKLIALAAGINHDEKTHSNNIMPKEISQYSENHSEPVLGYRILSLVGQEELSEEFNYLQLNDWMLGGSKFFRLGFYILTDEVPSPDGLLSQMKQDEIALALVDSIYARPGRCRSLNEDSLPIDSYLLDDMASNLGLNANQLTIETNKLFMSCFDDHGIGVTIESFSMIILKDHLRGRFYLMVRGSFFSE